MRLPVSAPARVARPLVMLAEDDDELRFLLGSAFFDEGWDVVEAPDGRHLVDYLALALSSEALHPLPDVVVSDIRMPELGGLDLLLAVRSLDPITPVILVTSFGDAQVHEEARRRGARAVLDKPFSVDVLTREVERALRDPWPTRAAILRDVVEG